MYEVEVDLCRPIADCEAHLTVVRDVARGGFFPVQTPVIRDVLVELEGVVRWGGDDNKPDESLFHLDVPPGDARPTAVAAKLYGWQEDPARGAGTHVDVQDPRRRKAADDLHHRQVGKSR
ncbi:hypothetical protein ACFV7Q_38750 [Streptomyces sp. NPDC059851]|uniref:hypothetical protein n=1 Tax=Streptomyces sp. NPDC059851 TaxID=3346971 RepID=UPI0036573F77